MAAVVLRWRIEDKRRGEGGIVTNTKSCRFFCGHSVVDRAEWSREWGAGDGIRRS